MSIYDRLEKLDLLLTVMVFTPTKVHVVPAASGRQTSAYRVPVAAMSISHFVTNPQQSILQTLSRLFRRKVAPKNVRFHQNCGSHMRTNKFLQPFLVLEIIIYSRICVTRERENVFASKIIMGFTEVPKNPPFFGLHTQIQLQNCSSPVLKSWEGEPESYSSVHAKNLRFTATIFCGTV